MKSTKIVMIRICTGTYYKPKDPQRTKNDIQLQTRTYLVQWLRRDITDCHMVPQRTYVWLGRGWNNVM